MRKVLYCLVVATIGAVLSTSALGQEKGSGKDKTQPNVRDSRQTVKATPATTTAPSTTTRKHARSTAHRRHTDHDRGTATTKSAPTRSNKSGAVRGQARAEQVHEMNQEKKASQKSKAMHDDDGATHGKGKGHSKK